MLNNVRRARSQSPPLCRAAAIPAHTREETIATFPPIIKLIHPPFSLPTSAIARIRTIIGLLDTRQTGTRGRNDALHTVYTHAPSSPSCVGRCENENEMEIAMWPDGTYPSRFNFSQSPACRSHRAVQSITPVRRTRNHPSTPQRGPMPPALHWLGTRVAGCWMHRCKRQRRRLAQPTIATDRRSV
jgi:hypothetical protein